MKGSPTGWPGPVANCAAAKIALTKVVLTTPTGSVARRRPVTPVAETRPFGAAAVMRSLHGITGADAARLRRRPSSVRQGTTVPSGKTTRSRSAPSISDWPPP
jgi:hypothetical protein